MKSVASEELFWYIYIRMVFQWTADRDPSFKYDPTAIDNLVSKAIASHWYQTSPLDYRTRMHTFTTVFAFMLANYDPHTFSKMRQINFSEYRKLKPKPSSVRSYLENSTYKESFINSLRDVAELDTLTEGWDQYLRMFKDENFSRYIDERIRHRYNITGKTSSWSPTITDTWIFLLGVAEEQPFQFRTDITWAGKQLISRSDNWHGKRGFSMHIMALPSARTRLTPYTPPGFYIRTHLVDKKIDPAEMLSSELREVILKDLATIMTNMAKNILGPSKPLVKP